MRISPAAVRRIAQDEVIHRVSKSKRVSSERFAAAFGCSPKVAAALWNRLDGKELLPRDALVKHLLWGLAFLKLYNVERAQAPPSGADEKTFRKWVWIVLDALAELDLVGDRPTDCWRDANGSMSALLRLPSSASFCCRSSGRTVLWRAMGLSAR